MKYEIQISNNQQLLPISDHFIEEVVGKTLASQDVVSAEIVIALVDDAAIHEVNREHLQHDYATDVISFLYDSEQINSANVSDESRRGAGLHLDGEIVVSTETAIREANLYDWSPEQEVQLYVIHGLLHLCGYDDLSDPEQDIMREQERNTLRIWGITPRYDE